MAHDQQIASHIVRRSSRRNVTQVKYKFDQDDEALEAMTVDEGGDTLMEDAQQSVSSPKKANGRTKKALVKPISMANKVTKRVSAKAPKKVNEDIQAKVTHDSAIATKRGRGSKQQVITSEDLVPDESDLLEPVGTPEVYADVCPVTLSHVPKVDHREEPATAVRGPTLLSGISKWSLHFWGLFPQHSTGQRHLWR